MPITCGSNNTKRKQVSELISNEEVLNLRLSQDEKLFYTELFYDNSKGGKVSRENFYPLLGALGTQISKEFSDILFSAFSSNKTEITIYEYLKYIDIYHYGDDRERCTLTCNLMDPEKENKISLKNFTKYINLIMNAVKKVTFNSNQELMSQSDINDLFYHISQQKQYFTYKDFEKAYREKPELISWFDYFKNNKSDLLLTINKSIRKLLNLVNNYLNTFMSDLVDILDNKKKINVKKIIQNVIDYSNNLENERKKFLKQISQFNIRWALEQSNNIENETQQIIKTLENKFFKNLVFNSKNQIIEKEEKKQQDKEFDIDKENNKYSMISSNSKNEKLLNNDIFKTNRDSVKKYIINTDTDRDNEDMNSANILMKPNDKKSLSPITNNNKIKRRSFRNNTNESPLYRVNTKNRVMQFFNDFKVELTKKKTIMEKSESEGENYKNSNSDINEDEKEFEENSNQDNNIQFNKIKEFEIEQDDLDKYPTSLRNPFDDQKKVKKEEQKGSDENYTNFEDSNNIKQLNKINSKDFIKKNSNNLLNSNTITNANNKDSLNIDKIHMNFNLKDTYKSEDLDTIYNNSDVDSEYTIFNDKMLRDDNIIYADNSNNNNNVLIKECINKNFSSLKQLLLCSRTVINNAHDMIQTFSSCYEWISENYLKEHINKKLYEEEKEKKRREEKEYDKKNNVPRKKKDVKKKIIRTPDESFKILLNIIMGIQISVQSCPNFRINKSEEITNYLNNMIHSIQTINFGKKQEEIFYLKEFAGIIFNNIRLLLGIDKESFISSISPQEFVTEIMISSQTIFEELCSTGKSGSLFYYTRDGRFIVKTISKKEYKFFKRILASYYKHLQDNPLSFLPKFLGCYKLIRKQKKKRYNIYFIVMINVFATSNHIDIRYDLKGSKIGRKVLKGTEEDKKILNSGDMALKDLDFEHKKEKAFVGKKKDIIISQLEKDSNFLEKIGSNDYSLLLGIHNYEHKTKPRISAPFPQSFQRCHTINYNFNNIFLNNKKKNKRDSIYRKISSDTNSNLSIEANETKKLLNQLYDFDDGGILSADGKNIYYIGIIDILTEYGFVKKTEHLCKMIRYCSEQMSCIPPDKYKERYINYMKNIVFDDKEFWKKASLNDNDNDNENNNTPKRSLWCSQHLNNINNNLKIKNDESNEDNKSDDYSEDIKDNKVKQNGNIKNENDININTDDFRIGSDHRLNFNFNKKHNSIDISNSLNNKNKK